MTKVFIPSYTISESLPVAGPLEALQLELLQPPLPTIPEQGGINTWRVWFSRDEALKELRHALDRVEYLRPRRMLDISK